MTRSWMYLARKGVIGRPLCRPRLHRSRPPITTPRSGFVQPTFRSVIVESFLCVSDLSKGNYIRSTTPEGKRKSELGSLVSFLVKKLPCAKPTPICGVHLQQANR